MIWLYLFIALIIVAPLLMFASASIASYVGIIPVVSGGLGAIVLFGSLPVPAAMIVSITVVAVYLGYLLINKETKV